MMSTAFLRAYGGVFSARWYIFGASICILHPEGSENYISSIVPLYFDHVSTAAMQQINLELP